MDASADTRAACGLCGEAVEAAWPVRVGRYLDPANPNVEGEEGTPGGVTVSLAVGDFQPAMVHLCRRHRRSMFRRWRLAWFVPVMLLGGLLLFQLWGSGSEWVGGGLIGLGLAGCLAFPRFARLEEHLTAKLWEQHLRRSDPTRVVWAESTFRRAVRRRA